MAERGAASVVRTTGSPNVYRLPVPDSPVPLLGVLCEGEQDPPFGEAMQLQDSVCGTHDTDRESWTQEDAQGAEPEALAAALREFNGPNFGMWNFDVCRLTSGLLAGHRVVAIGSNSKKRKRAGALAFALTGALWRADEPGFTPPSVLVPLLANIAAHWGTADGRQGGAEVRHGPEE